MNGMALNSQDRKNHRARRSKTTGGLYLLAGVLLLCSCATTPQPSGVTGRPELPPTVTMNEDAGRGGLLIVTLRRESGAELPVIVDTGAPLTLLDESLEPQLGECRGTTTLWNFGAEYEASIFAAPRLYLGNTRLITDSNALTSDLIAKMSARMDRPVLGILGMDCLRHYCVQLDFRAGKVRFLDPNRLQPARLGQAFPLKFSSAGQDHPQWSRLFIHHGSLVGGPDTDLLIDTGSDCDAHLQAELFRQEIRKQRLRVPADTTRDQEPNDVELPRCVWHGATYTDLWVRNGKDAVAGEGGENALGLRFLARHLVTFDFPHRTMYLKQTRRGPLITRELAAAVKAAGNSAFKPARKLMKDGQLPGWSKKDRGKMKGTFRFRSHPDTVTFEAVKKGDSSTYHYQFTRTSKDSPWQLHQAWRTDPNDHTVEEYPVP
jgi:hypothetical protein